ncbi:CRISPR-associated protein Cas4 [Fervidobacterium thailandense]|uniref:CRISPR-associated exonuclease Cas4 n=1 Tax=Fervidobacterium thailandense TaxID=1008305 RepID=A0A1E3G0K3_9BACT|nr:CRISPR-associated protein Cas4 [Fervidobacterium thailandense]ODN29670.1 hypothetical protein A4H02_09505 [Fervidobacterium thailandense]
MVEKEILQPNWLYSYLICKRQAWLISHGIEGKQDNVYLDIGRLIHEETYDRYSHEEIILDGAKIDVFFESKNVKLIGEIKASSRRVEEAKMQLLYYCYILKQRGLEVDAQLLIPREKKRIKVELNPDSEKRLLEHLNDLSNTIKTPKPPEPIRLSSCSKCAYEEFCWGE